MARPRAAHEQKRAAGTHLAGGVAGDADHQHGMLLERPARLLEVHLGQRRIVGTAGGDHDVVDRSLEICEESLQGIQIVGVEGRGAQRSQLARRVPQPVRIAADQDHIGSLGPGAPRRLEADAGAAADHHYLLPAQLGLALDRRGECFGGHLALLRQLAIGGPVPTVLGAAAITPRSAFSAAT